METIVKEFRFRIWYAFPYLLNAPNTINTQSSVVLSVQNTTGKSAEKTVPTKTPLTGATPFRIICHG